MWLVYGVVNTLAITFIAKQAEQRGRRAAARGANDLVLFLLIGTLVWAYLSAVLDDISLVITWERWEGTIEHTLMAPVPRVGAPDRHVGVRRAARAGADAADHR